MPRTFDRLFKESFAGVVDAAGDLTIKFGPQLNELWDVSQVSLEMPNAPVGASVSLRVMGSFVDAPASPRRASAGGDPPVYLNGGEFMTVEWINCTPGDFGNVWITYRKSIY